jgi:hypothetical protein
MNAAASDQRPRAEEVELCAKASHTDWLYLGGALLADVASIYLDTRVKYNDSEGIRMLGPAAVGLSWGFTLGGGYLALPKCSPDWVRSAPPEGDVRPHWQLAVALAMAAGLTGPLIVGTEQGALPINWTETERSTRLVLAGATAFTGALLPYLLPPKTWRAAKELRAMRAGTTADGRGVFVSYAVSF